MSRRTGSVLAAVGLSALTTLAVGCGRISHDSASGGRPVPRATTIPAASPPISTQASTVSPATAADQQTGASTRQTGASTRQTGAALTAVDSDTQAVDAATDQSDADFNAGVTAEAQNDQP